MNISDLLTIIGIILAIIAIISEKNREYMFLKFSPFQSLLLASIFIFIHYLVSYAFWREKFNFLGNFEFEGYPNPSSWAYIISILTLMWIVWRVFYGRFPRSNKEKLLKFYEKLMLRKDFAFLSQMIETYHIVEIMDYLASEKRELTESSQDKLISEAMEIENLKERHINRSKLYGASIFNRIIRTDIFIESVSNLNPHLFTRIIRELSIKEIQDPSFVNRYLKSLITEKNGLFFREIRNNQNLGEYEAYLIEDSRPILFSLFNDINVAIVNETWRGIGEPAIIEIYEEVKKQYSPLRERDIEQDEGTIWTYRIFIAIWYFDIMVRQAIKQKANHHMWMFYYINFLEGILENMKELPHKNSDLNRRTRNFDLIEDIFSNFLDWKKVIKNTKHNQLSKNLFNCLGQCLFVLLSSEKISDDDKNYVFNFVWMDCLNTYPEKEDQHEICEEIFEIGLTMFKRPSSLFTIDPKYVTPESIYYLNALKLLWSKRDNAKLDGIISDRVKRFKSEVIDILIKPYIE